MAYKVIIWNSNNAVELIGRTIDDKIVNFFRKLLVSYNIDEVILSAIHAILTGFGFTDAKGELALSLLPILFSQAVYWGNKKAVRPTTADAQSALIDLNSTSTILNSLTVLLF